jgi:sterol desaturase/sphingolipid hydroxylase (fatty acid hydroxylase superfamily)
VSLPVSVQRFREEYRAQHIGPRYRGWAHFAFTSLGSLAVIATSLALVGDLRAVELAAVPATFLFANVVEYLGHRGPMHRRRRGLGLLHRRHTLQHHRFYTREAMRCDSTRDFQMILFPPVMLLFFLGGVAAPIGMLLWWLSTANVALLFTATAMGYFLTYEVLHLGYHLGDQGWLGRLPFMARLRQHHMMHHDPALMGTCNFNITFPICDRLFGTSHRDAP